MFFWPTITYAWLDSIDPAYINNSISNFFIWWFIPALVIAVYVFVVVKYRQDENYIDNKYSRGHEWIFDGGEIVQASSSPHIVPLPYTIEV